MCVLKERNWCPVPEWTKWDFLELIQNEAVKFDILLVLLIKEEEEEEENGWKTPLLYEFNIPHFFLMK